MRVLWLSATPSLYESGVIGGWIASLEDILHRYHSDTIELGVLFETDQREQPWGTIRNNTMYYPVFYSSRLRTRLKGMWDPEHHWKSIKPYILKAVDEFLPDVIHCFGSEWPYGAIADEIRIPVIIHMQGFLNIYDVSRDLAISRHDLMRASFLRPMTLAHTILSPRLEEYRHAAERKVMETNHYFMGRTEWDRNIVRYYSKGAQYYHVPEAIRPAIYNADRVWNFHNRKQIRLITISQAGYLKGNEIILRTASILKDLLKTDFEWRVAGRKDVFPFFEKRSGIKAADNNIKLLGMIDAEQIAEELAEADFYIHPSIIDNSPNSLCEAQLIGCPVIAANVGGIPQLVQAGESGFLYPYNEPHTLAFMICNLLQDPELLTKVSKAEIEMSHLRHAPEAVGNAVYTTYEKVIQDYQMKNQ